MTIKSVSAIIILFAACLALGQKVIVSPEGDQPKCYGKCPVDLTGKWRLTWHSGARNTVSLAHLGTVEDKSFFEGSYIADDGEKCLATGFSQGTGDDGTVALRLSCKASDLYLKGNLELEGSEIQGTYTARGVVETKGSFKMTKSVCLLPEGCKK